MSVFVFIVTYNKLKSLKRVVECVKKQSAHIDRIFVINNSSTDGTEEWLSTVMGISVIKQENLGGAGGFHTGIKTCYELGADWIWMMDDDVFPHDDCLASLLKFTNVSECINTTRYWADGGYVPQIFRYDIDRNHSYELKPDFTKDYIKINTCCFEGLLISRNLVSKIGYPDKRFFVAFDDTIYGYLASYYTNPIVVKDAVADKLQKASDIRPRPFYTYYSVRNRYLVEQYKKEITGKGFTIMKEIKDLVFIVMRSFKFLIIERNKQMASALLRGYVDSLKGVIGKSY